MISVGHVMINFVRNGGLFGRVLLIQHGPMSKLTAHRCDAITLVHREHQLKLMNDKAERRFACLSRRYVIEVSVGDSATHYTTGAEN